MCILMSTRCDFIFRKNVFAFQDAQLQALQAGQLTEK